MEAFDSGNAKAVWSQSQGRTKSDDTALTEMTAAALERLAEYEKSGLDPESIAAAACAERELRAVRETGCRPSKIRTAV